MKKRRILYGVARNTYQRLEGALRYAHEHNWDLCVDTALTWNIPLRWSGDGIIALPAAENPLTDYVLQRPEPKVLVERMMPEVLGPRIVHDNVAAGRLAAEYFLDKGFENFAFINLRDMYFNAEQIQGFTETLAAKNHTAHICSYASIGTGSESGHKKSLQNIPDQEIWLRDTLQRLPRPLALFAADDVLAVDIINIALECGLRVPEDIAVLGTPNIAEIVERSPVPVSSIIMDEEGLLYRACALLDDMLDGKPMPDESLRVAPLGLAVRASTQITAFSDTLVQSGLAYIQEHYHEPIGVHELAEALGVDRRKLSSRFRKVTGHTPHEALCAKRLEQIKELLITTEWTLPHIAQQTGFTTHQYLCRFFMKYMGLSPTAYRQTRSNTI